MALGAGSGRRRRETERVRASCMALRRSDKRCDCALDGWRGGAPPCTAARLHAALCRLLACPDLDGRPVLPESADAMLEACRLLDELEGRAGLGP